METLFIVKKIISFLIQPYGLILSLFLCTIIFYFLNKKILVKLSFILGFLLFLMLSNPFIANLLSANLENIHPKYNKQSADFIVSLGNGHYETANIPISSTLSAAGTKRVLEAVLIYKNSSNKPQVIFTGYGGFTNKFSYAKIATEFATHLGINASKIITFGNEKDTTEEAIAIKKIVKNKTVILVTSAIHMPRAVLLFKKYAINIIPAPTDFKTDTGGILSPPSLLRLQQSSLAIHEYLGIIWYKLWKN